MNYKQNRSVKIRTGELQSEQENYNQNRITALVKQECSKEKHFKHIVCKYNALIIIVSYIFEKYV